MGVWVAFMVCGVHQAVAGGDPPSPAVPVQPVKADTAAAAPAATPASTTTVTQGATPAPTTTETEGAARVPAVVVKPTPHKNKLEDPVLTNDEVKRLLSASFSWLRLRWLIPRLLASLVQFHDQAAMRHEGVQALFWAEALCGLDESPFSFFGDFRLHISSLE